MLRKKTVSVRLSSNTSYEDFLAELERQELDQVKLLSFAVLRSIAALPSSGKNHIVTWILSTDIRVCQEYKKFFGDLIPSTQFVGYFPQTRPANWLDQPYSTIIRILGLFFILPSVLFWILSSLIGLLLLPMILDGRLVASTILENIKNEITFSPNNEKPMLAVVLVGDNPASLSYIKMKEKRAREVGMGFGLYRFEKDISQKELEEAVRYLSKNEQINGIIVQSPLPKHINANKIIDCIDPNKDVDGFTKVQIGNMFLGDDGLYSCTPKGIITMLRYYEIDVRGKNITVIGRSNIVGKPMALMLINAGATVTSCNSSTKDLATITRKSDIVIIAIGQPGFLTADMVTEDTIVIDVGSTFVDGVGRGDTDYENLKDYVSAITPVPGGVGPMTVATLIENTWRAFVSQNNIS